MQQSAVLTVFMPLVIVIIMLGLGLSLTVADFRKVLARPKPVIVALVCQTLVLPVVCFGIVQAMALPPALAVGMMLLAASPGGTSASLYSHLAGGDVALNIIVTAINSVLVVVTLPIIVNFSLVAFYGEGMVIPLQFSQILLFLGLVVVPAIIGMVVRRGYPELADRMERPVKILSLVFVVVLVLVAVAREWNTLLTWGPVVGLAVLAFNLVSMAVGYWVPRFFNLDERQSIAICMEIGLHNAVLVITIALSRDLLNNPEMAIPPALYGLVAYITAAILIAWMKRRPRAAVSSIQP
ncbi:bile acid:sodium symporter family protein [Mesorhizobium sp. 1B3]|uniref:bile acid:sodium symporter family protein n=1 Tax=Mesorhizobium sp. 1B3 TaxID=3243599 RepID=UPI003D966B89